MATIIVSKMNISDIKLNDHNPRDITIEQKEKLKKSLIDFPDMLEARPLIIDENNVVLGGNMRLRVLQELGYTEVPVKKVEGWTDKQKKEFIIKDNVSYGQWDWEVLGNEWEADELRSWGLFIPNWEQDVDYSALDEGDDEIDGNLDSMADGVRKSIQIEFTPEDYMKAYQLCQYARSKDVYIGEHLINLLQNIKDEYESKN